MKEETPLSRLTSEERDSRVLALYERVVEIEQRLIPTGLHVFGRASTEGESVKASV
jgi:cobalamin biosynthesis Mg chelatase CobN